MIGFCRLVAEGCITALLPLKETVTLLERIDSGSWVMNSKLMVTKRVMRATFTGEKLNLILRE